MMLLVHLKSLIAVMAGVRTPEDSLVVVHQKQMIV